jgi:glycosyltransferase involved in cell wall biosynthesis
MDCLLGLGYGVTFYPDNRAWAGRYTEELQRRGVEAWYDPWLGSSQSFLERQGQDFAAVVVSRHYIAINHIDAVRRHAPRARFIFDTVDLHYLREQRLAELEDSSTLRQVAKQTRRSELSVIRDADATLVVSPVEREVLAKDSPGAEVFILSNIHHVRGAGPGFAERKDLYFVGGYQHPPNIDAVQWFCADIWPLVREQLPEARFHIVGSKAPEEIRELGATLRDQGVVFHGFVEALDPFLEGCRLSVAPLRYGAGVKGKVNQAMSHGQPVVATSVAVEGLHAEDGRDVLVADEAAAFADAVVCAYEDEALWNKLSVNGVENVRRHFSLAAARGHIEEMFRALEID